MAIARTYPSRNANRGWHAGAVRTQFTNFTKLPGVYVRCLCGVGGVAAPTLRGREGYYFVVRCDSTDVVQQNQASHYISAHMTKRGYSLWWRRTEGLHT